MTTPGFLYINGSEQGDIQGASEHQEGGIEIYRFSHVVEMKKSLMLNQKFHRDIEVVKPIDRSTPKLYQALCSSEVLSDVKLVWYPFNQFEEENRSKYYQVTLEEAMITKIESDINFVPTEEQQTYPTEKIFFSYKKINWVWLPDGIEFEDEWEEQSD